MGAEFQSFWLQGAFTFGCFELSCTIASVAPTCLPHNVSTFIAVLADYLDGSGGVNATSALALALEFISGPC